MTFSAADILGEFVEAASLGGRWVPEELPFVTGSHASRCKRYRERHPLRLREIERIRRLTHHEERREVQARYRARHRERIRVRQEEWAASNMEKRRAQALAYYYRHREKVRAREQARRANRRAAS